MAGLSYGSTVPLPFESLKLRPAASRSTGLFRASITGEPVPDGDGTCAWNPDGGCERRERGDRQDPRRHAPGISRKGQHDSISRQLFQDAILCVRDGLGDVRNRIVRRLLDS